MKKKYSQPIYLHFLFSILIFVSISCSEKIGEESQTLQQANILFMYDLQTEPVEMNNVNGNAYQEFQNNLNGQVKGIKTLYGLYKPKG
ncbi:MAG: hypothetical protein WD431_06030 [Cyclobacteriaceae bacterium]